jgi:hypothetical protein
MSDVGVKGYMDLLARSVPNPVDEEVVPLHNDVAPQYDVKHEKPEHRLAVFLKAQGFSNREIAAKLGMTTVWVGYALKQPWARRMLLKEIQDQGRDGIHELLKGAAPDCVLTLIDIAADEKAKNSDRCCAATAVLDRFLGKPTQRIESTNTNVTTTMNDVKKMQKELEEVELELQRVTGGVKN